jgi:hypothetical protein
MNHFPIVILIGRPASGKSEIIDHLLHADPAERLRRFHVARPDVLDDFPMLWAWFEEDHLLHHKLNKPRLHTDEDGYFLYEYLWHVLIQRLDLEYHKRLREETYPDTHTTIIEFSRGSEHGGYAAALPHLSDEVLKRAVIVYVSVSFNESLRKNRRRFNPSRPDSILEHGLPDAKLERLYAGDDWSALAAGDPLFLPVRDVRVPYAVFENEDDVTTPRGAELAERLESVLDGLYRRIRENPTSS